MNKTQEVLNEYRSLKKSYSELVDKVSVITSRSVKYDKQSGNLTIDNVELTIE